MNSTVSASTLINQNAMAMWGGYTDGNIAARIFRSDALQVRFEKRAFGDASSGRGDFTWVFSYTFSKQMFWDCCIGQSWSNTVGANWSRAPTARPARWFHGHQEPHEDLFYWQPDSANKPQEFAFSGVWDLPLGKGRAHSAAAMSWRGRQDRQRVDDPWTLTYISGSFVGLPSRMNFCGDYTHYIDPATGKPTGQTPQSLVQQQSQLLRELPGQQHQYGACRRASPATWRIRPRRS